MRSMILVHRMVLLASLAFLANTAIAHEVQSAYLQLTQESDTSFQLLFKVPAAGDLRPGLRLVLPESCDTTGITPTERATIACSKGLEGESIAIDGLSQQQIDVLVRIRWVDGNVQVARLTPSRSHMVIEPSPDTLEIARAYALLGVEHILGGIDHLLFVLALLLLVRGWRRLVLTITAFTIAHSITLAAATLGLVRVSQQAVEAVIALSIVFVASELVNVYRGRPGLVWKRPWSIAFVFGLLHGFGFASALNEIGLPQQATPLALLLFNIGVEAGQLMFVTAAMLVLWISRQAQIAWPRRLEPLPAYGIGVIAAYWTIERTVGMLVG